MGDRKEKLSVRELKDKYNVTDVYSYSKLTTFEEDLYGYFLKYVLYAKEDRPMSCYLILGSETHELIQKGYEDKLNSEDMIQMFQNKLMECNLMENKFASKDSELDQKIEKGYEECVIHYLKNFNTIDCEEYSIEEPMYAEVFGNVLYGYIDMWFKKMNKSTEDKDYSEDDYTIYIQDFKTSTIYKSDKINQQKRQLLMYALFYHEKYKVPYEKIKIRWDFIKYVKCTFTQKNGMIKIQYIKRNELDEWLIKKQLSGIVVDIENGYYEIDFTEKDILDLKGWIRSTINDIESKNMLYELMQKDDSLFCQEIEEKNSFFFSNLSGYSSNLHKPYRKYLEDRGLLDKTD